MAGLRPWPGQGGAPAAPGPPPRACRRSGCPGRPGARGPPGRSPQRCRSAAGTATQHRAGTVTMPAGVTARDHHTGAGGQRQPVTGPPFQDAGDHLPGHPAGGVDPAHPVDRIRGHARRVGQRQGTASARTAGRAAGRAGGEMTGDELVSHGRLPGERQRDPAARRACGQMPAGVFKRCLVWGEITSSGIRGGLEYSSRGLFPGVVKSPAACSSAAKTGEISPAPVPERGLYPVFR